MEKGNLTEALLENSVFTYLRSLLHLGINILENKKDLSEINFLKTLDGVM